MSDDDDETGGLDAAMLTRWAVEYLARYAASTHRLRQVLIRRARRWCTRRDVPLPDAMEQMATAVATRCVDLGLIDDDAFALSRARSLSGKGWPGGRIRAALGAEGLDVGGEDIGHVVGSDEAAQARRFAERRRLGPFRLRDRRLTRDKDIRSLVRAGFSFRIAAAAIDADPE